MNSKPHCNNRSSHKTHPRPPCPALQACWWGSRARPQTQTALQRGDASARVQQRFEAGSLAASIGALTLKNRGAGCQEEGCCSIHPAHLRLTPRSSFGRRRSGSSQTAPRIGNRVGMSAVVQRGACVNQTGLAGDDSQQGTASRCAGQTATQRRITACHVAAVRTLVCGFTRNTT